MIERSTDSDLSFEETLSAVRSRMETYVEAYAQDLGVSKQDAVMMAAVILSEQLDLCHDSDTVVLSVKSDGRVIPYNTPLEALVGSSGAPLAESLVEYLQNEYDK